MVVPVVRAVPRRARATTLAALVACVAALLAPAAPATARTATAAPVATHPTTTGTHGAPVLLARAGSGTHSFGGGRSTYGSRRGYGYGYRRTGGHSFLHGFFVGWTLGHFFGFGGGIPLFPLLFFVWILYLMLRGGRRPPRRRGPWLQS
jgi:uncharacterized membrane protein